MEALQTGFGTREEPLLLCISTAGYDRASLFMRFTNMPRRCRRVRLKMILSLLAYEADPDDDWLSPET